MEPVSTFSIVARDPATGDLGIAVASKFLAVGSVVPFAKAGVGAVATQSYANTTYGPRAMAILKAGGSPEAVLEAFRRTDPELASRQFGLVAASGESLTFTGEACHPWAGGRAGQNYAAQGNLLTGPEVVEATVETFLEKTHLPFPERLLAALLAGDRAGGDKRGRQSAALFVVGEKKGYGGFNDRWIDLRVDDHQDPVPELKRLLSIHRLLFSPPQDPRPLSEEELAWLVDLLVKKGFLSEPQSGWTSELEAAFKALLGQENLEERYRGGPEVDEAVLHYLKEKFR
jgi:Uncharacterized conserved protein